MKIKNLFVTALMLVPTLVYTSCGGDDPDEPEKPIIDADLSGAILENTDILQTVDNSYRPTASYLAKTWHGEYEGWDEVQKKNTTISRELVLRPNGTYSNIIAGKIIDTGKNKFFKFESEGGTYTYNSNTGTVTYTVDYDSLLDYKTQSYDVYNQKKYYSKMEKSYTEKADFSISVKGIRRWVTRDMYLQSLTNKTINIAFAMDPARADDTPRDTDR